MGAVVVGLEAPGVPSRTSGPLCPVASRPSTLGPADAAHEAESVNTAPNEVPAAAGPTSKSRPVPLAPLRLAGVLAAVTVVACLANLLVPDLLSGTAVMNGSAKGTSLVALVVAVPLLAVFSWRAHLGSTHALVVTTGVTAYLLYNSVLFLFATPFNQAFLLYVAMLGLSVSTLVGSSLVLCGRVDRLATAVPWLVPVYVWVVVVLNATAWLSRVVPAMLDDDPTAWLVGSGLTTNPVIAQDLALWLPVMAWLGWGVWRARPPLVALAAAGLVFWVVESLGIAADQWWGHQADPMSTGRRPARPRSSWRWRSSVSCRPSDCFGGARAALTHPGDRHQGERHERRGEDGSRDTCELDEAECWELVRSRGPRDGCSPWLPSTPSAGSAHGG